MKSASLQQAMTQVIADLLARNRSYFGAGGPGYYDVEVENISPGGSEFDLIVTFRSGVHYCCVESLCHIALCGSDEECARWFRKVRDGVRAVGIVNLPLMIVRRLQVVVEEGAISDDLGGGLCVHERRLEYGCGPFHEGEHAGE